MKRMRKGLTLSSTRKQRGFSMAEALIAMAVTAFGLMAVGKFQSVTLISSGQSKARTEALALAEREIEQLRNYTTLVQFDNQIASTTSQWGGQNADFTITRSVTLSSSQSYKNVKVVISWVDRTGAQDVELTSFISRGDPLNASKIMIASVGGLDYFAIDGEPGDSENELSSESSDGEFDDVTDNQSDENNYDADNIVVDSDDDPYSDSDNSSDYYFVSIAGSITIVGNNTEVSNIAASGNYSMDCVFTNSFYSCESEPIPNGVSWSGTVSIKSNKTVCYNEGSIYYSKVSSNISQSYTLAKNNNSCP